MGAPLFDIVRRRMNRSSSCCSASLLVAFPLAFYAIGRWLETFAYHTDIRRCCMPQRYSSLLLVTKCSRSAVQAYRAAVADGT
ncbi:MAG: hypothetical protein IPJ85_01375 [Flavobacteriales bacterium]|nr:hypothetical protein [Flavobacteriales bacterium]